MMVILISVLAGEDLSETAHEAGILHSNSSVLSSKDYIIV